jgi:hypothetical protein
MGSPRGAQNHFFSTLSAFEFQNFLAPALTRQPLSAGALAKSSRQATFRAVLPPWCTVNTDIDMTNMNY